MHEIARSKHPLSLASSGIRPGIDVGPGKTLNRPAERVCDDAVVRKRVLIVDDHVPFRAVARELLERAGYIVTGEAGDAAEALAAIAAEAPDVVLLDVQLPDQDGFAVATAVAASHGCCGRPHLVTGCGRLRSTRGVVRSSRLHPQVEAVRRHLRRGARVTSADPVAATQPTRDVLRDPVLVAPLVVAAGLAVGALGIHAHVSETRIATDMGVAWALAAAALVTLGRPRRRRATWLLAAAAFALLGADLEWADTHALWTLGLVSEQLWIAVLAVLLLALPEGRRSSPLTRWAIAGAFAVTLAGQVAGALVDAGRARPAVGRAPRGRRPRNRPSAGVRRESRLRSSSWCCSCGGYESCAERHVALRDRLWPRPPSRLRSASVWLGLVIASDGEQAESRDDRASDRRLPPDRRRRGDPLVAFASTRSVRARRRVAGANAGDDGRAPRGGAWRPDTGDCLPARRRAVRRRLGSRCRAATRPRPRRHRYHGGRRRGGRARSRSRVARRTGARRVRPRHCRARPRESSDSPQRCGHSWPRFGRHANASCLPPTPNVAGSSATCTMARSSGS